MAILIGLGVGAAWSLAAWMTMERADAYTTGALPFATVVTPVAPYRWCHPDTVGR